MKKPTPKNKNTIGIVGGGQLGRMLAMAAKKMGFKVIVLDPTPNSPAGQVCDMQIVAGFKDAKAIRELESLSDFVTFEIESADAKTLEELASKNKWINPSPKTLKIIKDKFGQKKFLEKNKIPVAKSMEINSPEDAIEAGKTFGYPFLLKARFDAYDGRGNALIKNQKEIDSGLDKLGYAERDMNGRLYAEKFVPFTKELAVVAARGIKGEVVAYPVVETVHKNNICHTVTAPAVVSKQVRQKAEKLAEKILTYLGGVGVYTIEMFLSKKGDILVNEIAPRVHNSGHYTIEGNITSQFEQHIRAVTGLPLGSTAMVKPSAVMINILGERAGPVELTGLHTALKTPGVYVHVYGKIETRPERKMGHITVVDMNHKSALKKARQARKQISI